MMAFTVHVNAADKARLFSLMVNFPRETYRGLGRSGATIRSKMRKLMSASGGTDGVHKFAAKDAWTGVIHPGRKLGGILSKAHAIQMKKEGKASITIGFLSALEPWAKAFQEKETRPMSAGERHMFHKLGFALVPNTYARPARDMVEPFGLHYQSDLLKWAIRNTEKILAKAGK